MNGKAGEASRLRLRLRLRLLKHSTAWEKGWALGTLHDDVKSRTEFVFSLLLNGSTMTGWLGVSGPVSARGLGSATPPDLSSFSDRHVYRCGIRLSASTPLRLSANTWAN